MISSALKMLPGRLLDNAPWRQRGEGRGLLATSVIFGWAGCVRRRNVWLAGCSSSPCADTVLKPATCRPNPMVQLTAFIHLPYTQYFQVFMELMCSINLKSGLDFGSHWASFASVSLDSGCCWAGYKSHHETWRHKLLHLSCGWRWEVRNQSFSSLCGSTGLFLSQLPQRRWILGWQAQGTLKGENLKAHDPQQTPTPITLSFAMAAPLGRKPHHTTSVADENMILIDQEDLSFQLDAQNLGALGRNGNAWNKWTEIIFSLYEKNSWFLNFIHIYSSKWCFCTA